MLQFVFWFQARDKVLKVQNPNTPPPPPPPPRNANVLEELENMNLDGSSISVINAQSLLIKYFKSLHKSKMPDIVKQTLETVSDNVLNLGIENVAQRNGNLHNFF